MDPEATCYDLKNKGSVFTLWNRHSVRVSATVRVYYFHTILNRKVSGIHNISSSLSERSFRPDNRIHSVGNLGLDGRRQETEELGFHYTRAGHPDSESNPRNSMDGTNPLDT